MPSPQTRTSLTFTKKLLRSLQVHTKGIIYGGTDGIITIFAVVAGVSGASLPSRVLLVLGIATLIADAMSMSVSDYMSSTAEREVELRSRKEEEILYDTHDDLDGHISYILKQRGFSESDALVMSPIIARNRDYSVDLLVSYRQETGMESSPISSAAYTFVSFIFFGMIPLLADILFISMAPPGTLQHKSNLFWQTSLLTAFTLGMLGYLKAVVSRSPPLRAVIQMVLIGGTAAFTSWLVAFALTESTRLPSSL